MYQVVNVRITIIGLLILLVACGAGVWIVQRASAAPFIAPGAADVRVTYNRFGEQTITYSMPNPDDAWQTSVARRLSKSGWDQVPDVYHWGRTETITTLAVYTRTRHLWFVTIDDEAAFMGSRSSARIVVRSQVKMNR